MTRESEQAGLGLCPLGARPRVGPLSLVTRITATGYWIVCSKSVQFVSHPCPRSALCPLARHFVPKNLTRNHRIARYYKISLIAHSQSCQARTRHKSNLPLVEFAKTSMLPRLVGQHCRLKHRWAQYCPNKSSKEDAWSS